MTISLFKKIFIHTIPVLAGYAFLGTAFGLLMRTKGYPAWLPILMSAVIYSGALEFAAVPVLAAAFDPIGSFVMGLMISARHLFYGIPMLEKYKRTGTSKAFLMFGLTDETFSVLTTENVPDGIAPKTFYLGVTALDFSYWVGGTAIGALLGSAITIDLTGIDFALTALFVVLFIEQISSENGKKSGFLGLVATATVLAFFGTESLVIIAMCVIFAALVVSYFFRKNAAANGSVRSSKFLDSWRLFFRRKGGKS